MSSFRLVRNAVLASSLLLSSAHAQQMALGKRARTPVPHVTDCNDNGIDDIADLALGASLDCNGNQVPDECDLGRVTLLSESFESGLPAGWTTSGLWHITDGCFALPHCDGTSFAYFGDDSTCTFESALLISNTMTLPVIELPVGATSIELSYCSNYDGEGGDYDAARVVVNGAFVDVASPLYSVNDWETRTINLDSYAGQAVTITFHFYLTDLFLNAYRGWQVDKVRLTYALGQPAVDCNANGLLDTCEADCDLNGTPDECDLAMGAASDCNFNGIPDVCDTANATSEDCNLNGVPDECDVAISLPDAIANLDAAHPTITAFFPNTYDLHDGHAGYCMTTGPQDVYLCGNRLNTNLASDIDYTGSVAVPSSAFGPGSSYFTAKYPGLFVMGAVNCSVDTFEISGANLYIGNTPDSLELSVSVDSQLYTVFVKRAYGGSTMPSQNQLIIVPGDGSGLSHTFSPDSISNGQVLDGLSGIDRIFYVLVARLAPVGSSSALRIVDAREIARAVIEAFPAPASPDTNGNGIPDECD